MRFLCLFLLFWSIPVFAETVDLSSLNSANEIQAGETKTFSGAPAIVMEKTKPQEAKTKPFPKQNLVLPPSEIQFQTPFGQKRSAIMVDHTTDFVFVIQVLDSDTVKVEEHIQFITTKDLPFLKRTYTQPDIHILSVRQGKQSVPFSFNRGILTTKNPLSAGFYNYTITYLVHGAIAQDKSLATLSLSLTGLDWPFMTERLAIVLLMPKKGTIYTNELLFGSNHQKIEDMTIISTDVKGNIVYQLKHPLPAYAEVGLNLIADSKIIPQATPTSMILIFVLYVLILAGYTLFSILTARHKKYKYPLKQALKTKIILWATLIKTNGKISWKQKTLAFLWFNLEYIVGFLILMACMIVLAQHYNITFSSWVLIVPTIIGLYFIHHFGTRAELLRRRQAFYQALMDTPQGLNLPQRMILTYYHLACLLGFGDDWSQKLKKYNPNLEPLFDKEKSQ